MSVKTKLNHIYGSVCYDGSRLYVNFTIYDSGSTDCHKYILFCCIFGISYIHKFNFNTLGVDFLKTFKFQAMFNNSSFQFLDSSLGVISTIEFYSNVSLHQKPQDVDRIFCPTNILFKISSKTQVISSLVYELKDWQGNLLSKYHVKHLKSNFSNVLCSNNLEEMSNSSVSILLMVITSFYKYPLWIVNFHTI